TTNRIGLVRLIAALAVVTGTTALQAAVLFDEQFNGNSLDPAWAVSTSNVSDYKYSIASSMLTFTDSDPAATYQSGDFPSAISVTTDTSWGNIYFRRTLSGTESDFTLTFAFNWDNNVVAGSYSTNNVQPMPAILINLRDGSNNLIATAGMQDDWSSARAKRMGTINGVSHDGAINDLPFVSNGSTVTITRTGNGINNITMTWAGDGATGGSNNYPITGTNTAPLAAVEIQIRRYRHDPTDARTGLINVDQVKLENALIPEPASLALLTFGAALIFRRSA
ncbi:MAG: hypothetical protein IT444_10460, partial [Phycisphaeraceae bacterium]|nr:hypothetical protein [Phycisphaeraceae bacterium]